ncbi:MAG TPA: DNA-processing protein DprA [Trinickia sp.]|uniref:DNA-processing protein DprA n=1 Tax=Trinickia sp. TaxID=2571163 RepID=UPI002BCC8D88|nr:DNA-processing protein DprA [Trinickia sp.]HTI16697.1 DNA-processing protein DprA [Trinickia sp.]
MQALPMTEAELSAWLCLAGARGLTPAALRTLVNAFGGAQAVRAQPFESLAAIAGPQAARAAVSPPAAALREAVANAAAWCLEPGNAIVPLTDPAYPAALLTMHDPPALLYVKGRLELLHAPGVAVVGSRNATPQGLEDAASFARALAAAGLTVISGLALGIDGAAHRAALDAAGATVAVIGTGADIVYPARHRALAHEVAARGAIVSEWPLGTPARRENFPRRNRLIAGLARGVLIVEAAPRSGSLITARLANEMGREVFAVPGSIHAPLSRGCHQLIKEGAKLTETPEDIFDELGVTSPAPPPDASAALPGLFGASGTPALADTSQSQSPVLSPARRPSKPRTPNRPGEPAFYQTEPDPALQDGARASCTGETHSASSVLRPVRPPERAHLDDRAVRVLHALGHAPATLEILVARTGIDGAALQGVLLGLELGGHVSALPGGRYSRIVRQPR